MQEIIDDGAGIQLVTLRQVDAFEHDALLDALSQLPLGIDVQNCVLVLTVEIHVLGQIVVVLSLQKIPQLQPVAAIGAACQREVLDRVLRRRVEGALVSSVPLKGVGTSATD